MKEIPDIRKAVGRSICYGFDARFSPHYKNSSQHPSCRFFLELGDGGTEGWEFRDEEEVRGYVVRLGIDLPVEIGREEQGDWFFRKKRICGIFNSWNLIPF